MPSEPQRNEDNPVTPAGLIGTLLRLANGADGRPAKPEPKTETRPAPLPPSDLSGRQRFLAYLAAFGAPGIKAIGLTILCIALAFYVLMAAFRGTGLGPFW